MTTEDEFDKEMKNLEDALIELNENLTRLQMAIRPIKIPNRPKLTLVKKDD